MFDSLMAMTAVQKIKKGENARLSKSQIASIIVNLQDASKNLPKERFSDFYRIFQRIKNEKQKIVMDYDKYLEVCNEVINDLGEVAPYEFFDGEMSMNISKENDKVKENRLELFYVNKALEKLDEVKMDAEIELFSYRKMTELDKLRNIEEYDRYTKIVGETEGEIETLEEKRKILMDEL